MSALIEPYTGTSALRFDAVKAGYGAHILFSGFSFELLPSNFYWLSGDNGTGKTTILRLAAGLTKPISGKIHWIYEGQSTQADQIIAYQGHNNGLKGSLTVLEDLQFWAKIYKHKAPLTPILEHLHISNLTKSLCQTLSAGQKRRVALARMVLTHRPIWLMDEPTAAMDASGQDIINDLVWAHLNAGGAVLMASHSQPDKLAGMMKIIRIERNS